MDARSLFDSNPADHLYRYREVLEATYVDDYESTATLKIRLEVFPVHHRTKCGAWIYGPNNHDGGRFVNLLAYRRYACNTKAEALESFKERKIKQIAILTRNLKRAKEALRLAEYVR